MQITKIVILAMACVIALATGSTGPHADSGRHMTRSDSADMGSVDDLDARVRHHRCWHTAIGLAWFDSLISEVCPDLRMQTQPCVVAVAVVAYEMWEMVDCAADGRRRGGGRRDGDADGTPDYLDGCPSDPEKSTPGWCGCGMADADDDGDGAADCLQCPPDDAECDEPEDEECSLVQIVNGDCNGL